MFFCSYIVPFSDDSKIWTNEELINYAVIFKVISREILQNGGIGISLRVCHMETIDRGSFETPLDDYF